MVRILGDSESPSPDDAVRALGDRTRRTVLDILRGGPLAVGEIARRVPVSRPAVSQHLRVLENAALIFGTRVGVRRVYALDPRGIATAVDWLTSLHQATTMTSKAEEVAGANRLYAASGPFTRRSPTCRSRMETSRTYYLYVAAEPSVVWQAFTDPRMTEQYYFGSRVESDWQVNAEIRYLAGEHPIVDGKLVEKDDEVRLVTTFNPHFFPAESIPESTVAWQVEAVETGGTGDLSRVTITHSNFDFGSPAAAAFDDGWVQTLSALKTLLETGKPLPRPSMG